MKLLIVACLVTITFAARLDNAYGPPFGANRYLGGSYPYNTYNNYNPYNPAYNAYNPGYPGGYSGYGGYNANAPYAQILRYNNQNNGDGSYQFDYATSNGITQQESGHLKSIDTNEVRGSYSYTSPEGKQISVNYVADEYGFRPSGDHLPTPPPVPDAILKSLQYNAAHPYDDGQYRDNRYDPGYYNRNYYPGGKY